MNKRITFNNTISSATVPVKELYRKSSILERIIGGEYEVCSNPYLFSFDTVLKVCTNAGRISGGPSAN